MKRNEKCSSRFVRHKQENSLPIDRWGQGNGRAGTVNVRRYGQKKHKPVR